MPNGTEAEVVHINESLKADYHFATNATIEWPKINHQTLEIDPFGLVIFKRLGVSSSPPVMVAMRMI